MYSYLEKHVNCFFTNGSLTWAGRLVTPAVTGRPVFEVVVAVVRPQAAVVEAQDIVHPVGLPGNSRRFLVGRWAPVMCSVWSTTPNRVCCQDLSTSAVVTTLLSCCILWTVDRFPNIAHYNSELSCCQKRNAVFWLQLVVSMSVCEDGLPLRWPYQLTS